MKTLLTRCFTVRATVIAALLSTATGVPQPTKNTIPGASDTEIKLGQTVPHSGPGSLYGVIGRVGEAYFKMLNEKGGINGRKVTVPHAGRFL